jgi:hypothetical protein
MGMSLVRAAVGSAVFLALVSAVALTGALAKTGAVVHPTATVTSTKVSGKSLRFVVDVSFSLPAGTQAARACKGGVKLTEKVKPHHKAPHWTAKLAPDGDLCKAVIKGSLPAALKGHKLKFALSFPGNGQLAPFTRSTTLKLSAPAGGPSGGGPAQSPPPAATGVPPVEAYTAADGKWHAQTGEGGGFNLYFTVLNGTIQQPFSPVSSPVVTCDTTNHEAKVTKRYIGFTYRQQVGLDSGGHFSDTYQVHEEGAIGSDTLNWHVQGTLGAKTGEFEVALLSGEFIEGGENPQTLQDCHASWSMEAFKET